MKNRKIFRVYPLIIIGLFLFLASSCKKNDDNKNPISGETITDVDGNIYHSVTIGTQVWMVENLKTTKYRNGDPIANITDNNAWVNSTTGAYCNFDNNANNSVTYGRLYNWYAVGDSRNIAPIGWHVPTTEEWISLFTFIEDKMGKLKETGTAHWVSPNTEATNETGFTALPGGLRQDADFGLPVGIPEYHSIGSTGYWWSSSSEPNPLLDHESTEPDAARFCLIGVGTRSGINQTLAIMYLGMSVRCVKD